MKSDYFADLVGGSHVTQSENDCVTTEIGEKRRKHGDSAEMSRMSRTSRTESNKLEEFRDRVWHALQAQPSKVRYFEVIDPDADPVRVVVAIRRVGTCDLLIDRDRWDPVRFFEMLDRRRDPVQ